MGSNPWTKVNLYKNNNNNNIRSQTAYANDEWIVIISPQFFLCQSTMSNTTSFIMSRHKLFAPSKFFDICCLSCLLPINLLTTPVTSSAPHFNYTTLHLSFHRSLNWIQKLIGPPCSKVGKYVLITIGLFNNCTKSDLISCLIRSIKIIWTHMGQIPQKGEMCKIRHIFLFFEALLWPNGLIFSSFLHCSEEILPVRF